MAQLTLRTLLAYLDDTLEPALARQLGAKVADSEVAQKVIERIKKVTRRRGLRAPTATPDDDGVRLPRLGVFARCVVFCQGFAARDNPWCAAVRFAPAKGEVLTVRVPGVVEARVVHRGVWLAPAGGDLYRAGSTYDRADLTPAPTAAGREQIVARLRLLLRVPFEIVGNAAAVRPIVEGGRPVFGTHPGRPRIGYFNGLGSKGVLHAPAEAARFAARLAGMLDSR